MNLDGYGNMNNKIDRRVSVRMFKPKLRYE